jgi:(5-formylfuran-3-yl)methyl phosphate synthase
MRLLVSVASAAEASAALAGGADVIDAKDALAGALGAVSMEVLREIHAAVASRRPVTAALGDAADEAAIERAAREFAAAGAAFVKVGFSGIASAGRVAALTAAAVRGARAGSGGGVVAVAYADADRAASLAPAALVEVAARAGAEGVLLDTADKGGPGLRGLVAPGALVAWVAEAHQTGLLVALAGKLTTDDLPFVRDAGADIAGVRGAACVGGRTGRVAADRVRLLMGVVRGVQRGVHHEDTKLTKMHES